MRHALVVALVHALITVAGAQKPGRAQAFHQNARQILDLVRSFGLARIRAFGGFKKASVAIKESHASTRQEDTSARGGAKVREACGGRHPFPPLGTYLSCLGQARKVLQHVALRHLYGTGLRCVCCEKRLCHWQCRNRYLSRGIE